MYFGVGFLVLNCHGFCCSFWVILVRSVYQDRCARCRLKRTSFLRSSRAVSMFDAMESMDF